jgi:glycosyltransferase involved in cell wall biosynthesis
MTLQQPRGLWLSLIDILSLLVDWDGFRAQMSGVNEKRDYSWFFILITLAILLQFLRFHMKLSSHTSSTCALRSIVLSILMPNYNKGVHIMRAIYSVLRQTLRQLELIISDDESDDLPWQSLLLLLHSDTRIHFFMNRKRLGIHRNRAKCVCAAHGIWLLSLDSDDELMNRTGEITMKTHQYMSADMVEFKSFQIDHRGRLQVFEWAPIPFSQADNNTLVAAFRQKRINWTLWRKTVARSIYEQALLMMGANICTKMLDRGEDKLHCATMYRFVHKFIRIDYYGYVYYQNVYNNSERRIPHFGPLLKIIDNLIRDIYSQRLPDYFTGSSLNVLCLVINQ